MWWNDLDALTRQQQRQGIRRLLVLSGEPEWGFEQASRLKKQLAGDWLWVGESKEDTSYCAPGAIRRLLGREFLHAIFDARTGLNAEALAALAGTLRAGSWLVLLAPPWASWPKRPDDDSLRWSGQPQPIPTPRFIHRLQKALIQEPQCVIWRQGETPHLPSPVDRPDWQPAAGGPLAGQRAILNQLLVMIDGVAVVTGSRGRGKSALAGMLAQQCGGPVVITAPARASTDILTHHAGDRGRFMAPDVLLQAVQRGDPPSGDWLIVDEAAAISAPLLRQLIAAFPRALLTTTVQGYEGTGRGFLLKLCASLPRLQRFSLDAPVRWATDDPLERLLDRVMLFDDRLATPGEGDLQYQMLPGGAWQDDEGPEAQTWRLLAGAHYRTSPLDLRRLLDAPGQRLLVARGGERVAGALWLIEEGGLSPELSEAVWAGLRRPRGNLVAQSLAAHGGSPDAAALKGLRISRVAVHPERQRQGIGSRLLAGADDASNGNDYLSVSFGYTDELWRFWQRAGFILVRIGTHVESSSGCHAAMALRPLSARGEALAQREHLRLRRDAHWLQPWIRDTIPVALLTETVLNDEDWRDLGGFAFGLRSPEACIGTLQRLLINSHLALPGLRGWLTQRLTSAELCALMGVNGRRALLVHQRQECAAALKALDAQRGDALESWLMRVKHFQ
ncbi:GNAT family N-acetyltransferase [Erwinia sp. CPCC 100877]|nr:GNAT family N-acetyltransferase [Erwinia sp. CPCC 100877]